VIASIYPTYVIHQPARFVSGVALLLALGADVRLVVYLYVLCSTSRTATMYSLRRAGDGDGGAVLIMKKKVLGWVFCMTG
jgi:hypothetical protein